MFQVYRCEVPCSPFSRARFSAAQLLDVNEFISAFMHRCSPALLLFYFPEDKHPLAVFNERSRSALTSLGEMNKK